LTMGSWSVSPSGNNQYTNKGGLPMGRRKEIGTLKSRHRKPVTQQRCQGALQKRLAACPPAWVSTLGQAELSSGSLDPFLQWLSQEQLEFVPAQGEGYKKPDNIMGRYLAVTGHWWLMMNMSFSSDIPNHSSTSVLSSCQRLDNLWSGTWEKYTLRSSRLTGILNGTIGTPLKFSNSIYVMWNNLGVHVYYSMIRHHTQKNIQSINRNNKS
jgi:hypothetical protein